MVKLLKWLGVRGAGCFFLALILLSSCKSKKALTSTNANQDLSGLITHISQSTSEYKWLRSHANFSYSGNGQEFSATASMKMRKDSLIWGAVNLFLELARGEITKDSVSFLNRTDKSFSTFRVANLQNMLAIPGLTITAIQKLLLAEAPFGIDNKYNFERGETDYKLSYTGPQFREDIMLDAATLKMKEYTVKRNESQKIHITYTDFEKVEKLVLPKKINFEIESQGSKTQIIFDFTEYSLHQADEAAFSIPPSYKRR